MGEGQIVTKDLNPPDNQLLDENAPDIDFEDQSNTSWF